MSIIIILRKINAGHANISVGNATIGVVLFLAIQFIQTEKVLVQTREVVNTITRSMKTDGALDIKSGVFCSLP